MGCLCLHVVQTVTQSAVHGWEIGKDLDCRLVDGKHILGSIRKAIRKLREIARSIEPKVIHEAFG